MRRWWLWSVLRCALQGHEFGDWEAFLGPTVVNYCARCGRYVRREP